MSGYTPLYLTTKTAFEMLFSGDSTAPSEFVIEASSTDVGPGPQSVSTQ
jgi:hypothetical protein